MEHTLALPVIQSSAERLRTILEQRPLYINIETTNICNARCVFCAYPKMRRAKEVMSPALFEKIVGDYVDMGGGAIGLTPIVGDVLLDPHLLDRLRILRRAKSIKHIGFTTNAIAWSRYGDDDQKEIMESVQTISVSLGGLDAASYERMFAVDRLDKVRDAVEKMCELKARYAMPVHLDLLFRVSRPIEALLADPKMEAWHRPEINHISAINSFGNWGGLVVAADLPDGAFLTSVDDSPEGTLKFKASPCFAFYLAPEITTSGLVSACGCMNAEAEELVLGDVSKQHLQDIWRGQTRKAFLATFGTTALPDVCKKCSYYADGTRFLEHPGLARFEIGDNPWALMQAQPSAAPAKRIIEALAPWHERAYQHIALYGAGMFTRTALADPEFDPASSHVVALIDDNPALIGGRIAGLPVVSPQQALELGFDAVLLSADPVPPQLVAAAQRFRAMAIQVASVE